MITVKSAFEIALMREACAIVRDALEIIEEHIKPGITTGELDGIVRKFLQERQAGASFLGYGGFPAAVCASVNDEVIHGIPGRRVLLEGDIISVDIGAYYKGFHGDAARTFPVVKVSDAAQKLITVTRECFFKGAEAAKIAGARVGDIGAAVQKHAEASGFSVVRAYVGHGIGKELHEDPTVPNFGKAGHGTKLLPGMTLAVEPMVNEGVSGIYVMPDKWTVKTADAKLSAHYENTILITEDGIEILTL